MIYGTTYQELQRAYQEVLATLPDLRERCRIALARFQGTQEGPSITACKDAREEWQFHRRVLTSANDMVRHLLGEMRALQGLPKVGRDRSGRSPARVETIQRRQDKLNAQARKRQRGVVHCQEKFALNDPYANLRGALQYLFREAFGEAILRIILTSDETHTLTIEGSTGTYVVPGPSLTGHSAYMRGIQQLTKLLDVPKGAVRIRAGESWEEVGWVVETRDLGNSFFGANRYEDARDVYHNLTGVHADSDPDYLPQAAPQKP